MAGGTAAGPDVEPGVEVARRPVGIVGRAEEVGAAKALRDRTPLWPRELAAAAAISLGFVVVLPLELDNEVVEARLLGFQLGSLLLELGLQGRVVSQGRLLVLQGPLQRGLRLLLLPRQRRFRAAL